MPVGLLFATMEPPANIEEEFQDWYDTEHFPERQSCPGFLTANRFVCIEGWPRYLAMYDLEDVEVLRGEGYHKIAHGRYSAWTHRIIPKVTGQYRAEGVQVYPGDALHGKAGTSSRTLVLRFRSVQDEAALVAGLRKAFEGRPQTTQLRVFKVAPAESGDYLAMIELRAPVDVDVPALGEAGRSIDMMNTYIVYSRQAAGAFPSK